MKEHPFFKGIDWQQVYLQKVRLTSDLCDPVIKCHQFTVRIRTEEGGCSRTALHLSLKQ